MSAFLFRADLQLANNPLLPLEQLAVGGRYSVRRSSMNEGTREQMFQDAGGLVRWPVKIFLPLGFALLSLQGFSELIKRIAMLTGHMETDVHYERPLQ